MRGIKLFVHYVMLPFSAAAALSVLMNYLFGNPVGTVVFFVTEAAVLSFGGIKFWEELTNARY